MTKREWVHFGMAMIGMTFIVLSIGSGLAAYEYVILHEESAENEGDVSEEIDRYGMVQYDELSVDGQQIVDCTIESEQCRFHTGNTEAILWSDGRVVSYNDQYHVISREKQLTGLVYQDSWRLLLESEEYSSQPKQYVGIIILAIALLVDKISGYSLHRYLESSCYQSIQPIPDWIS